MKMLIRELSLGGDPDKLRVQKKVKLQAEENPQKILEQYINNPATHKGKYICSDMFKEMFEDFNKSPEHRNKYNNAVHNTAATLAALHFSQMVKKEDAVGSHVVFLTGSPGAGKTTTVAMNLQKEDGSFPENLKFLYEGQLANGTHPATLDKFRQCLEQGLSVEIMVVHPKPEVALENTFSRFNDFRDGRGASIQTMARIQGNTYDGIKHIYDTFSEEFSDKLSLYIVDSTKGRNETPTIYTDWNDLKILRSQGNEEQILKRLETHLVSKYNEGVISNECLKQAVGTKSKFEELQSSIKFNSNSYQSAGANEYGSGVSRSSEKSYNGSQSQQKKTSKMKN